MSTRAATPKSTPEPLVEVRAERYRLLFDRRGQAAKCAQIAGACRFVYNLQLAICEWHYAEWLVAKESDPEAQRPGTSFETLGKRFTVIRNRPDEAWFRAFLRSEHGRRYADKDFSWLGDLPYSAVRYASKYLADAYTRFFKLNKEAKAQGKPKGFPRRKAKYGRNDGFTIPQQVSIDGDRLHIPKVGKARLKGGGLYLGCKPKHVRVIKEGTENRPQWYAHVFYEVPVGQLKQPARTGALGLDRNVGQATDSDKNVYAVPDDPRIDAKIRRKQRELSRKQGWGPKDRRPKSNRGRRVAGQLKKLNRKKKRRRENAAHQQSRRMADTAHTVVVENLNTKGMTKSAKGTVEEPGTNVKQKAGLNRGILKSNWGRLELFLNYKAGVLVKVDAAYTSQTCSLCGHASKENRKTQAHFNCTACGHTANADHNAALNILARGLALLPKARGTGASARRESHGHCPVP